jgi:hypothetical protein
MKPKKIASGFFRCNELFGVTPALRNRTWWAIHNIIAHPLMELLGWIGLRRAGNWLHDKTVP